MSKTSLITKENIVKCPTIVFFLRFLKDNNCYVSFFKNVYKYSKCTPNKWFLDVNIKYNVIKYPTTRLFSLIQTSFFWGSTREGELFWRRKHYKLLEKYCSKEYEQYIVNNKTKRGQ